MQVRSVEVRRHLIGVAMVLLGAISADQARALSGTQAGAAISSANAFVKKAEASKCADPATRQALERQGQAIVGELQTLTSAAIGAQQSDVHTALIDASVKVTDAMHELDRGCDEPPHRIVRNVTYLPLAPVVPIAPYVGLGFNYNFGSGNWIEPGSDTLRKIDTSGLRGQMVVGFWYWKTWGAPFVSEADADDYYDCDEIDFDSDYCEYMWGQPSYEEAGERLREWAIHHMLREYRADPAALDRIKTYSETHLPPPQWLFGIENSYSFGTVDGSTATSCFVSCRVSSTQVDTLMGKVGLRIGRFTPYVGGGAAFGDIHMAAGPILPGNTIWNTGWAAAAGLEVTLSRKISADFKYVHTDLGSGNCGPTTCGGFANYHLIQDSVSASLHYNFDLTNLR